MKVGIVGAGIVGSLLAKELLACGVEVTLFDQAAGGTEASWAGGGIVSPLYPWRYSQAITQLASKAQNIYPALCNELHASTGVNPEFNPCGMLMLDMQERKAALAWAQESKQDLKILNGSELYNAQAGLHEKFEQALWMPYVGNVRNPRLLQALRVFLRQQSHFTFLPQHCVKKIHIKNNKFSHLEVTSGESKTLTRFAFDKIVVTAGAWSQALLQQCSVDIAVKPMKGQMLCLQKKTAGHSPLKSIVLWQGKYIIPRLDGRIIAGSTLEDKGFDKQTDSQAQAEIVESIKEISPLLGEYVIEKQWAGLRPASADGVPVIGELPNAKNVHVNTGHFRNGLVLAPASALLHRQILLDQESEFDSSFYTSKLQ